MGVYTDRGATVEQLPEIRLNLLNEIEVWYGGVALDVFDSSALVVPHRYWCDEAAQLRAIGSKVANRPTTLMCGIIPADPESDPVYEWKMHTSTEAGKVHTDYMKFTETLAEKRGLWIQRVNAATTIAEVDVLFDEIVYGIYA